MAVPAAIIAVTQTYGPTLARAAGNYLLQQQGGRAMFNTLAPAMQGNMVGGTMNANPVMSTLNQRGMTINPGQMTEEQLRFMQQNQQRENDMARGNTAYAAGLTNAGKNLNTQRQMAMNAQLQRAQAALNMMNNTANSFGNTLQTSSNAMQGVLNAF